MHQFEYVAPSKLADATALMAKHAGSARMLAGGTDLLIFMRVGRRTPDVVIDAKKIPELTQLEVASDQLTIGASVTCREIWENAEIAAKFPALIDATTLIGGVQIQGRASIGGNLCNAAPSADTVPAIIAYGATAHVANNSGTRDLPVEEICTGPGQTSLAADEILVNITVPMPPASAGAKFLRFIPRNEMDIAVANVGSYVELDGNNIKSARVAIGAVAPTPLFVEAAGNSLVGKTISDEAIATAAAIAREAASPINDMRGTVEHRKQLVEVLTRRTLNGAIARAKGE